MAQSSVLGYPRIGLKRELKKALESHWAGELSESGLFEVAQQIKKQNWTLQKEKGIDSIPSNDFSLYDHVLDTIAMVGAVPKRYNWSGGEVGLKTYFAMARGDKAGLTAMDMTKWFDTNYHYIVPEFEEGVQFKLSHDKVIKDYKEAKQLGLQTRPVLVGPVSFLKLGKIKSEKLNFTNLLQSLLPVYEKVLSQLAEAGAEWVQIDEPCLVLGLSEAEKEGYRKAYQTLSKASSCQLLLATYFGGLRENLSLALELPVKAFHVDLVRAPEQLDDVLAKLPATAQLSLGLINGRNVWKADLNKALNLAQKAVQKLGSERVQISSSCSLMFSPVDLSVETSLDPEVKNWMAYAVQKLDEVVILTKAVNNPASVAQQLSENKAAHEARAKSAKVHNPKVKERVAKLDASQVNRTSAYPLRRQKQIDFLKLPIFPTTTIGSFAQTSEVRLARADVKAGRITQEQYEGFLRKEIEKSIRFQEEISMDVLVHGEFERNDMVEYFGEQMSGFVHTKNGWVQSYGSRCVKPPVIYGDVSRPAPMTVDWWKFAQSCTKKPVKGMLTGPVTILQWSFVRDDQPRSETCKQIAFALRDEVVDLEAAGNHIIQIDEPALREGLPLRKEDWAAYLKWAVDSFRISASGVHDKTQIHTHMCYSEFNDIIKAIADLDADVISIETSRSQMELLQAFTEFKYPNEIGPGVYDIHSPRIPTEEEMIVLLKKALAVLSPEQIWVNPDCGLKTRKWEEIKPALAHMTSAAIRLRQELQKH